MENLFACRALQINDRDKQIKARPGILSRYFLVDNCLNAQPAKADQFKTQARRLQIAGLRETLRPVDRPITSPPLSPFSPQLPAGKVLVAGWFVEAPGSYDFVSYKLVVPWRSRFSHLDQRVCQRLCESFRWRGWGKRLRRPEESPEHH